MSDIGTGRGFESTGSASDTRVVISDGLWHRLFGRDPHIVGRTVWVSGMPATVIGVTARGFEGLGERRLDVLIEMSSPLARRRHPAEDTNRVDGTRCCLMVAGRMRDGWGRHQVLEELEVLTRQYRAATRQPDLQVLLTTTAPGEALRTSRRGDLLVMILSLIGGAVVLVLLLTCANVGNLYLARSLRRQREIAIRLSLGASRWRIVRQLLTEGLVLATVAGLCAYAMTAGVPALLYLLEDNVTASMFASDWRVALFTVAGVIATCLLVSLAPALQTTRIRWRGASLMMSARAGWMRGVVLAVQIAIAAVLVTSAMLLARGIDHATRVPADFALRTTTAAMLTPATGREYGPEAIERVREGLSRALDASDLRVGIAGSVPVSAFSGLQTSVRRAGSEVEFRARLVSLTAAAADVLDLQLLAGRWTSDDPRGSEIVVNERLARQLWREANPIGQQLVLTYSVRPFTVVGLTRDAHLTNLGEVEPMVHLPLLSSLPVLLARNGPQIEPQLRALVAGVDPDLSIALTPLSEAAKGSLINARTGALIAGSLGVVALLLSIVGVFGVFSYLVEERRQEIGVRLALGATRREIARALFGATRGALVSGLAAGVLLSVMAGLTLRRFLFGLSPTDPVTYLAVGVVLGLAALTATAVPVRRALRVDPAVTLRAD